METAHSQALQEARQISCCTIKMTGVKLEDEGEISDGVKITIDDSFATAESVSNRSYPMK